MMRHSSLCLLWAASFVAFTCFAGAAADLRAQSAGDRHRVYALAGPIKVLL